MMRFTAAFLILLVAFGFEPEAASACERCFGAGSDAPAVAAVSASMFALLVVISSVFVGVVGFFRNVQRRTEALEASERLAPRNGRTGVPPYPTAPGANAPDNRSSTQ